MLQTMMIALREGLEALLIVALAALYLRRTGRAELIGALRSGVVAALLLSVLLGVVLARVGALSPAWEGSMALLAAVTVLSCTWHMMHMGRHMKAQIDGQLGQASGRTGAAAWWAVFAFALFMVGREGVETATMTAALAASAELGHIAWGGALGFGIAAAIAWMWTRHGHRVNLGRFFQVTAAFMVVFSLQLMLYAFHEFTEAALLPGLDNEYWHKATEDIAEGAAAQVISLLMVALPSIWLVGAFWKDRRTASLVPQPVREPGN